MKCAAIALALQGTSGLVAPRLTVKSSALNAATLEVQPSDATKVILAKSIAARLPPAQKPAGSGTDARALLPGQRCCKKPHLTHTSAEDAAPHPWLQKSTTRLPRHQIPNNSPTNP